VVTAASITSLVAPYGSFTTKVSGVAAEFSGIVSALTFDGALTGNVTGNITGNVTGDIDGAIGSFSACISTTNIVAATGSFTTKVSGVAAEFSGNVCALEFYGDGSNLTNVSSTHPTSVAAMTINTLGVVTAASITSLVAPYGSFTTKVSGVAAEFSGIVSALTFDGALTGNVTGDIDGATGSFSACISSTNIVAATGSFTTKVSGVAAEFSGAVSAYKFYGDGANLTNVSASNFATSVVAMTINTLGVVTAASITSLVAPYGSFTTKVSGVAAEFSGIVSALTFDGALTGDVTGNVTGNVTGDIDGATGSFSACVSSTNLVAATGSFTTKVSGVAAEFSGNVCASEFYGGGSNITGLTHPTSVAAMTINTLGVVTAASITSLVAPFGSFTTKVSGVAAEFSGIVSALTFDGALTGNVTGDIDGATGSFSACISTTNLVAATGSFTTKVSGVAAEFSGNVCAVEYYGDGSNLTDLPTAPTSVAAMTINTLGVVTAASITSLVAPFGSFTTKVSGVAAEFSGIVSALTFDGALTGDVTGNLTGNITGDIDGATGSFSACISTTNLVAATGSFTTKVSGVAAEFSGNVCAVEYYGDGSNLTGITTGTSAASYTINRLHVVSAVSITGTASIAGGLWANGGVIFNEAGADVDFRVETASISDILKVDSGDDTTRIKGFIYEQQVISASVSSATHVIDLSKANVYDLTFLNNCSLSFSNVAPSGRAQDFTMIIRRTAAASISFDPIILTAGGIALGLADTSGRTDVLTMFTVDGGSQFYTASSFLAAATVAA
jgi:hypothetical protein